MTSKYVYHKNPRLTHLKGSFSEPDFDKNHRVDGFILRAGGGRPFI